MQLTKKVQMTKLKRRKRRFQTLDNKRNKPLTRRLTLTKKVFKVDKENENLTKKTAKS